MGPFSHGAWSRETGKHFHNEIYFGDSIATYYQTKLETPFFKHYLKGNSRIDAGLPEAVMYDTGNKEWKELWQIIEGKKYKEYKDYDGSDMRCWWD